MAVSESDRNRIETALWILMQYSDEIKSMLDCTDYNHIKSEFSYAIEELHEKYS